MLCRTRCQSGWCVELVGSKVEGEHSVVSVHPVVECACSKKESIQINKYHAKCSAMNSQFPHH